jgi:hypothetical protein
VLGICKHPCNSAQRLENCLILTVSLGSVKTAWSVRVGEKKVKEQKKMIQKCRKSTIAETGFETWLSDVHWIGCVDRVLSFASLRRVFCWVFLFLKRLWDSFNALLLAAKKKRLRRHSRGRDFELHILLKIFGSGTDVARGIVLPGAFPFFFKRASPYDENTAHAYYELWSLNYTQQSRITSVDIFGMYGLSLLTRNGFHNHFHW